ncbi:MAG: Smr/MutS family protein [Spirochaetia bacterium]
MSDFGDILEQWERRMQRKRENDANAVQEGTDAESLAAIIEQYPPETTDVEESDHDETEAGERLSPKRLPPEDSLDLHGMSGEQARRTLRRFLTESRARGLRKVLIVHGKGNHNQTPPVLKRIVAEELEASPIAGQTGVPSRELGGSGAVWVAIRDQADT